MPPKKRSFVCRSGRRCHRKYITVPNTIVSMRTIEWFLVREESSFLIMSFIATYNPCLTPRWWPHAMNKDCWQMITASWWTQQWKKDWRVLTTISILYFFHNGCVKARNPNKSVLSRKKLLWVSANIHAIYGSFA